MRDIFKRWAGLSRVAKTRWFQVAGGIVLLTVAFQLLYPVDRALPFARIDGDAVGFSLRQNIDKKLLSEYSKGQLATIINDKETVLRLSQTGVLPDNEKVFQGVSDAPWYLRAVPFGLLIKGAMTNQSVTSRVDTERFSLYAAERIKECDVAPKNAGVVAQNGDIVLDPAKDGTYCTEKSLREQITSNPLTKDTLNVTIRPLVKKPTRSDADVAGLLKEAKRVAERQITLSAGGKIYPIDKPTLASWLAFPEDPTTKKLTVGLNDEMVTKSLEAIQKEVYIAPGKTYITTVDGIEKSRVPGANGQGIDMPKTIEAICTQVLTDSGTVTASLASLPPQLVYSRSYSKTPEGLQALVNDLVKDKGDFAISVRKLADSGVHANGDKQYHPASTYKLYVAYSVMKRVDDGRMSWGQSSANSQTVSQCFDNMIVNSDNTCAEWFGRAIGWSVVTGEVRSLGLSRTELSRGFVSTTNDLALFLQKLESNQIGVSEPSRARLLEAMKRQIFRQGIPAGVGVSVADKVGFLEGYLHDAAIVYSPSGVYVLTIMSKGSSWAQIADAARQIHAQLQ